MRFIAAYDISDNKKRNRVVKLLMEIGIRTQFSVFEFESDEKKGDEIFQAVSKVIDPQTDRFFLFPLSRIEEDKIIRIGKTALALEGVI